MTHKNSWGKRLTAAAGVTALVAAGFAGTAFAASNEGGPTAPPTGATTKLTIHKRSVTEEPTGTRDDGTENSEPGGKAIAGVKFKVTPLCVDGTAIDLTTSTGWNRLQQIVGTGNLTYTAVNSAATANDSDDLAWCATSEEITTDGDGKASPETTLKTLYKVEETFVPTNSGISEFIDPFVVSVPLYNAETKKWNYDVHVYPKNVTDDTKKPTKKVVGEDLVQEVKLSDGTQLTYKITFAVPQPSTGTTLTSLQVKELVPDGLKLMSVESVKNLTNTTAKPSLESLTLPTLAYGDDVTMTFETENGVVKGVSIGDKVEITVKAAVSTDVSKSTRNSFEFYVNGDEDNPGGPDTECPEGTPECNNTDVDTVKTAIVAITKVDGDGNKLSGAEFEVYVGDGNGATTGSAIATVTSAATTGLARAVVTLPKNMDSQQFCFKETKAPVGYKLDTTSVKCVNAQAGTTQTAENFVNVADDRLLPQLPLTGANGLMVLTLGGAALVLLGVGSVMVVRRRQAED